MAEKVVITYNIALQESNENIQKLFAQWSANQDRSDWVEHGCYPTTMTNRPHTFCLYVVTKTSLTVDQKTSIINLLKDVGATNISTHIEPRPAIK